MTNLNIANLRRLITVIAPLDHISEDTLDDLPAYKLEDIPGFNMTVTYDAAECPRCLMGYAGYLDHPNNPRKWTYQNFADFLGVSFDEALDLTLGKWAKRRWADDITPADAVAYLCELGNLDPKEFETEQ